MKSRKQQLRQLNSTTKKSEQSSTPSQQDQEEAEQPSTEVKTLDQQIASTEEEVNQSSSTIVDQPTSTTPQKKLEKRVKRPKNLDSALEKISKKKIKTDHLPSSKNTNRDETKEIETETKVNGAEEKKEAESKSESMIIDQPGALPRFPAPINSSRPDPRLLARLAIGLGYPTSSNRDLHDFIHFQSQSILNLDQVQIRPSSSISSLLHPNSDISSPPFSLSSHSVNRLTQLGFKSILAVQIAVLSILMPSLSMNEKTPGTYFYPTRNPPRDLCVNAPTGSGKTLSYIIPIIETLKSRLVCRIRALIVLPTRDLVLQVKHTFDTFSSGTALKAAILTGHHSFSREQALIGGTRDGLEGLVDVVIATPGRLLDHLTYTPGFTTDHLCFLVLDEADQLLNKNSQNWLHQILNPTQTNISNKNITNNVVNGHKFNSFKPLHRTFLDLFDEKQEEQLLDQDDFLTKLIDDDENHNDLSNPTPHASSKIKAQSLWTLPVETFNPCRLRPFRILLFSATLKRDPTQVDHLGLRNPIFLQVSSTDSDSQEGNSGALSNNQIIMKTLDDSIDQMNGFSLPSTLKQHIIVTRTDLKPLVFMKLIITKKIKKALCFCKSIEGAERLTSLCKLMFNGQEDSLNTIQSSSSQSNSIVAKEDQDKFDPKIGTSDLFKVECFSSDLSPVERSKLIKGFQLGQINMLICSDMIARGIDIPQVENVINYDAPIEMKKYVHRVGRTARANQIGFAFTLIESQEAKFFKNFLKLGLGQTNYKNLILKLRFNWFDIKDLNDAYQVGLKKLAEKYGRSIDL